MEFSSRVSMVGVLLVVFGFFCLVLNILRCIFSVYEAGEPDCSFHLPFFRNQCIFVCIYPGVVSLHDIFRELVEP